LKELVPLESKQKDMESVSNILAELRKELNVLRKNHDLYQSKKELADNQIEIENKLEENEKKIKNTEESLKEWFNKKEKIAATFNKKEFEALKATLSSLQTEKGSLEEKISESTKALEKTKERLKELKKTEKELITVQDQLKSLESIINFAKNLREYFNIVGPKMVKAFLKQINVDASSIYKDIMDDPNLDLIWDETYLIHIRTRENKKEIFQLSGGEQMAAALAVRLAILQGNSLTKFAFFDEPTTNLDTERRVNLSKIIQRIKGFQQIFVISHDDSFEEDIDNVIKFTKDENEETKIEGMITMDRSEDIEFIWD